MTKSVKILENIDPEKYDVFASHPMQSFAWGQARIGTGVELVRIGFFKDEILADVFQMTLHKIPKTKFKIGYIPRSHIPTKEVVDFLTSWMKQNQIIFIKWEPYVEKKEVTETEMSNLPNMHLSTHPMFSHWNQLLDLTPSKEELLAKCHEKTRYSVRLSERKGVVVKEMSTDEGFKTFCDLYFETCARQKYHGHNRKYHQVIWNTLHKAGMAKIFVAYYKDEPVASFEIFFWKDKIFYPYGGTSNKYRNIPYTQLLMWETILAGKNAGAKTYDMWGSLSPDFDKKHPWSGFTYFKQGFGTRFIEMTNTYDLVGYPTLYTLYSLSHTIRKFLLKFKPTS